jgi:hypothetical protein
MPAAIIAWLAANWVSLVWQVAVPAAIWALRKAGFISWAEALEDRMYAKLKTLETDHQPKDFPDPPPDPPDTENGTNTNMTVGGYRDQGPRNM